MVKFFTLWAARLCSLYNGVTLSYAKFNSVDMYIYFKTHCWLTATRTLKWLPRVQVLCTARLIKKIFFKQPWYDFFLAAGVCGSMEMNTRLRDSPSQRLGRCWIIWESRTVESIVEPRGNITRDRDRSFWELFFAILSVFSPPFLPNNY